MNFRSAASTFRGHRQPHFNFIGRTKWWFALSGTFILLSLIGLFARGLNYSIDFKGGAQLRYPNPKGATVGQVQQALAGFGRADAEVQVVGTGGAQSEIVIRTRSLNDLGGPPQTKFTFPDAKGNVDSLKEALAEFGVLQPRVKIAHGQATVTVQQGVIGASHDVTVVYRPDPSKQLTADDVKKTMASLGRTEAQVVIFDGTVVIRTPSLTAPPAPTPSPSASPTPTVSGSPGTSPSPATTPSAVISAAPTSTGASAAAAAAPTKAGSKPGAKPSTKPSPKPSPSTQPSPSVAPTSTPTPSPSPTGPPTAKDILSALTKQAGISGGDITVRTLKDDSKAAVVAQLAQRAGIQPSQVLAKNIGGDERARLLSQLGDQAGIPTDEIVINDVGPTWGAQISKKAVQGLIIFLILVTLYISFRFEWKMAGSALTALAHDLIITAGIYALVGREVTPETVIAILTILGYSLYDTVVIFDRVKENTESLALVARDGYSGVVNLSLNETLMRSVNTSLVVLLPILALLLFGGATLKDFAFALFIGVASGAYSSIFIAAPMLALLKEREPRYAQIRLRAARATTRGQGAPPGAAVARSPRTGTPVATTRRTGSTPPTTSAAVTGDGAASDVDAATTPTPRPAGSAGQARSGSGGRPSGARSGGGGGRSKSKKRTPPAKRRRR